MNPLFHSLVAEFAVSRNLPFAKDVIGLEFDCENVGVWVMPHPVYSDHALVEATVTVMNHLQQAQVAPYLLQVNESARFEHGWTIVMDPEGQVLVSSSLPLQGTTLAEFENALAEGVDQAQALAQTIDLMAQMEAEGPSEAASAAEATMVRV